MTTTDFEILARSLRPRLLKVSRQIVGSVDDAEDVVQDTMLKLWSMRGSLGEYRSVEALSVLIVKRLSINFLRANRANDFSDLTEVDSAEPSADEIIIRRQTASYVDEVLSSLPDTQQTLIRLRHIEGYDNARIAALLGTSEGAVRTALSRARRKVAEVFNIDNVR